VSAVKWAARAAALALLGVSAAGAATLPEAVANLQAGRAQDAERQLREIVASSGLPAKDRARAYFYLGTIHQLPSKGEPSKESLQVAERYYTEALQLDPNMGGALNNLARVQLALGRSPANATEIINRAIALKDGRQSLYEATRAEIAERSGDAKAAADAARQALLAAPQDEALRRAFVARALKAAPVMLTSTVDTLLERGESLAAQGVILDSLADRTAPRIALMERLADVLAVQSYDPRRFTELPAAAVLDRLKDDSQLGVCSRELLDLHAKPAADASHYQWWTTRTDAPGQKPEQERTRRFARLVTSLGRWYQERGNRDELAFAAPYAEIALEVSGSTLDPRAILDLATVYANTGQRDKIRQMSDRYVQDLFMAKGSAYLEARTPADFRRIYELHLALGAIYGYLEQWGDRYASPQSATFQLEHVLSSAKRVNDALPADSKDRIVVPASAIQLLARAYDANGRYDDSVQLRVNTANQLLASPNPRRATEVLKSLDAKPVDVSRASPQLRAEYEKVQANAAKVPRGRGP
jgi:tetratricopeptide (TPR) repeat protein